MDDDVISYRLRMRVCPSISIPSPTYAMAMIKDISGESSLHSPTGIYVLCMFVSCTTLIGWGLLLTSVEG
jgi:hypothetical protein